MVLHEGLSGDYVTTEKSNNMWKEEHDYDTCSMAGEGG